MGSLGDEEEEDISYKREPEELCGPFLLCEDTVGTEPAVSEPAVSEPGRLLGRH